MPAPEELRLLAERERRNRRALAGAAAAAMVAVLAVAVGTVGRDDQARLAPARPEPSATWSASPGSVFVADPVMSEAGWNDLLADLPSERTERTRAVPHPLDCISDPATLGAAEKYGGAYLQPDRQVPAQLPRARMNVYVLWFADLATATDAVTGLRRQFADCPTRPHPGFDIVGSTLEDELMKDQYPLIEQQFTGETGWQLTGGGRDAATSGYDLNVARAGKLVVAWESLNGWADRRAFFLGLLMNQAVAAAEPRNLSGFEPDEDAYVAAIQKLDDNPGDASWRANVLVHGRNVCKVLDMGEPAVAARLAHTDPAKATAIVHAALAHLCPQ
jgi:hypothetical protein